MQHTVMIARQHQLPRSQIIQTDSNSCCCKKFESYATHLSHEKARASNDSTRLSTTGGFSTTTPKTFRTLPNNNIVIDSDNFTVNRRTLTVNADKKTNQRLRPRAQHTIQRRRTSSRHFQATARGVKNILFTLIFNLIFCAPLRIVFAAAFWPALVVFFAASHLAHTTLAQSATASSPSPPPVVNSFSSAADIHQNIFYPTSPTTGLITDYYDYENNQRFSSSSVSSVFFETTTTTTPAGFTAYDSRMENITMNYYNLSHATTSALFSSSSVSDFITSTTAASVVSSQFELFNNNNYLRSANSTENSTPIYADLASSTSTLLNATHSARLLLVAAAAATVRNSSSLLHNRGSSAFNRSGFDERGTSSFISGENFADDAGEDVEPNAAVGADIKTLIVLSVLYGIISITAIVGNFFVIWIVATCRRMQSVTNYLLSNLALADMLIGALSIPFQFQAAVLQRWDLPPILCPVAPFVQSVTVTVSIISLTVIACDRYRAFIYPLKPRLETHTAYIIIPSMWVAGIICGLPQALALRVIDVPELVDNVTNIALTTKPFCYPASIDLDLYKIYSVVIVVLQYFIPLIIIIFCYSRIGKVLWWDSAMAPGEQHHTMLAPTTSSVENDNIAGNTEITKVKASFNRKNNRRTRGSSSTGTTSPSANGTTSEQQQRTMLIRTTTAKYSSKSKIPVFAAADNSDDGCTASFAPPGGGGGDDNNNLPAFWDATINNSSTHINNKNNNMRMNSLNASIREGSADQSAAKQLHLRRQQLQAQHSTRETNKRKVIKMLILVVSMFALCWVPLQTYNVLFLVWEDVNRLPNIMIIWLSINWLAMSNSSVNPIIYGIYNDRFRKEFRKKLNQCFLCRKPPNSPIRNRTLLTVGNNTINGVGTVGGGGRNQTLRPSFTPADGGRAIGDGATIVGGLSMAENDEEEESLPNPAKATIVLANNATANHNSSFSSRNGENKTYQVYNYDFNKASPTSYDDDASPTELRSLPPSITVTPLVSTTSQDSMYLNNSGSNCVLLNNGSRRSFGRSQVERNGNKTSSLNSSNFSQGKQQQVLASPVNDKAKSTLSSSSVTFNRNVPKISIEDDFDDLKDDEEEDETGGFGRTYRSNRDVVKMRI